MTEDNKVSSFSEINDSIDLNDAILNCDNGNITFTFKQTLKHLLNMTKHLAYVLFSIVSIRKKTDMSNGAILVYGIGDENLFQDNDDSRFVEFCKSGQVEPLNENKYYFIKSSNLFKSSNNEFNYCTDPLVSLLRESKIGFLLRCRYFIDFLSLFFICYRATKNNPELLLIAHEFVYARLAELLTESEKLQAIVLTCSSYTNQSLFTRVLQNVNTHMIWYAQAWKPINYKDSPLDTDVPNLKWIRADTHWVWTKPFADYLMELGLGDNIKVVGPIVWCMPEYTEINTNSINLVVFDASPFSDEVALRNGQITNYHNPANLFKFINDIIELSSNLESQFGKSVKLTIKTKRGYNPLYDKEYFEYLENLDSKRVITLANHNENPYKLIFGANIVIAYPFTSALYISDSLNKQSIYYDPTGNVIEHHFGERDSLIHFASGKLKLLEITHSLLKSN